MGGAAGVKKNVKATPKASVKNVESKVGLATYKFGQTKVKLVQREEFKEVAAYADRITADAGYIKKQLSLLTETQATDLLEKLDVIRGFTIERVVKTSFPVIDSTVVELDARKQVLEESLELMEAAITVCFMTEFAGRPGDFFELLKEHAMRLQALRSRVELEASIKAELHARGSMET